MNAVSPTSPLKISAAKAEIKTPFEGDLLDRKSLAEKYMTPLLSRLKNGGVIVLDAPWGEGKTWFAQNWRSYLQINNYPVIYIDAFENDYIEDPFLLLTSHVLMLTENEKPIRRKIGDRAAKVAKIIIPSSAKLLIDILGRIALGMTDASDSLKENLQKIQQEIGSVTERILSEQIKEFELEQSSIKSFKLALAEFTEKQTSPVVIIIDELDRCKPSFAIQLLERIKHFFDVPNLVFVLMVNQDQLEKSVRGIYGSEIDASNYLLKFVDLSLRLPKNTTPEQTSAAVAGYIRSLLNRFQFNINVNEAEYLISSLNLWASLFDLSLRDIQRILTLIALTANIGVHIEFKIYLAALKIKHSKIFYGLYHGKLDAHTEAEKIVQRVIKPFGSARISNRNRSVLEAIVHLHKAGENNFLSVTQEQKDKMQELINVTFISSYSDFVKRFCRELDSPLAM